MNDRRYDTKQGNHGAAGRLGPAAGTSRSSARHGHIGQAARTLLVVLAMAACSASLAHSSSGETVRVLRGTVRLDQDALGRIVVLVERAGNGHPGILDDVFIGVPAEDVDAPFMHLPEALVVLVSEEGGEELSIRVPGGDIIFSMQVSRSATNENMVPLRALARWSAPALAAVTSSEPTFDGIDVQEITVILRESTQCNPMESGGSKCEAGGPGATECSADCAGSIFGLTIGTNCSVTCGEGSYACCNCDGLLGQHGSCVCVPTVEGPSRNLEPELTPGRNNGF